MGLIGRTACFKVCEDGGLYGLVVLADGSVLPHRIMSKTSGVMFSDILCEEGVITEDEAEAIDDQIANSGLPETAVDPPTALAIFFVVPGLTEEVAKQRDFQRQVGNN